MGNHEIGIDYLHLGPSRVAAGPVTPWGIGGKDSKVVIVPYPDHGRAIFAGSTINQHPITVESASKLSPEQSGALNTAIRDEAISILEGRSTEVARITSRIVGRPDIHVLHAIAENGQEAFAYYVLREFMGAPAIYISAKTTLGDISRIEGLFRSAGYTNKVIVRGGR